MSCGCASRGNQAQNRAGRGGGEVADHLVSFAANRHLGFLLHQALLAGLFQAAERDACESQHEVFAAVLPQVVEVVRIRFRQRILGAQARLLFGLLKGAAVARSTSAFGSGPTVWAHGLSWRRVSISPAVHRSGGLVSQNGGARKNKAASRRRIISYMPVIRCGEPGDLEAVAAIQANSPEAAHWPVAEYPQYEFLVSLRAGAVAGFLVWRPLAEDECEVLNLAVAPTCRRQGIARQLLESLLQGKGNTVFLEVRESNLAARNFYKSMGFHEVGIRDEYYDSPPEPAIVMKFHSC